MIPVSEVGLDRDLMVRHLASAIWPNHDPKRDHLALFTAYFDASGHPDAKDPAPALFVSGLVARMQKWARFERHWLGMLAEHSITPPFHMTDFEAGRGQYAAWRGDAERREAFRFRAIDVINRHTNKAFSVGIVVPDLRRMFEQFEVPDDLPRQPYPWCAMKACDYVARWALNRQRAGKQRGDDRFRFVFEYGDKHQGLFTNAFRAAYHNVPLFDTKAGAVPLQACDFVAWEHRNWLARRSAKPGSRPPRPSAVRLVRLLAPDSSSFSTLETLSGHCEQSGYPRRQPESDAR